MFKNCIKIVYRNFLKHLIHSIINILGLSVGIAISIQIMILVQEATRLLRGSHKQLNYSDIQFPAESVFFSFLALFLSLAVLEILMKPFNNYSGKGLNIFYFDTWYLIPSFILSALFIGIISGSYPAFYFSSFRVINIIKGRNYRGMQSNHIRGFIVVSQFTRHVQIRLKLCSMKKQ